MIDDDVIVKFSSTITTSIYLLSLTCTFWTATSMMLFASLDVVGISPTIDSITVSHRNDNTRFLRSVYIYISREPSSITQAS